MKHFLIKYTFKNGPRDAWHGEIKRFIAALESDPKLKGRVSYRCMKARDSDDYFHFATVIDDSAPGDLGETDFFKHYTEASDAASGGTLEVLPLEVVAETAFRG
ncbi:MAG TPA: hypothetical protein VGP41_17115 [Candidatus Lustribacter sp.]|jgi:hypothetical protein|nr:hypothetical protein [Candidatus Lustribacter sp.]